MRVTIVYSSYESLGVEYCSAVAREQGHETQLVLDPRLFEDTFLEVPWAARIFDIHDDVVNEVVSSRPEVISFGVVTDTYQWSLRMAAALKKRLPDVPIVMGGIHVTSVGEIVLEEPQIDFIVRGEGEYAFTELLDSLEAGKVDTSIENLGYRDTSGKAVLNPLRPTISDLDTLPFPDKSLYDHTPLSSDYLYTLAASRGCSFACSFCNNSINKRLYRGQGKWLRRRSPDSVLDEIRCAKKRYKFESINFYDEIFTEEPDWLEEFCTKYGKEFGFPYICCVHPRQITKKAADLLASSGCVKIDLGVQTTDSELRKHIVHRPETNDEIASVFDLMRERGVSVHAENIFGLPGQTEEQLVKAASFYNENRPGVIKVYWLSYYPGTEIIKHGLKSGDIDPEHVKLLERGLGSRSIATGGTTAAARKQYQSLFSFFTLVLILPKSVVSWVLRKRLYRWIPSGGLSRFSTIIMRTLNTDEAKHEIMKYRYKEQYKFYLAQWFRSKWRKLWPSSGGPTGTAPADTRPAPTLGS